MSRIKKLGLELSKIIAWLMKMSSYELLWGDGHEVEIKRAKDEK